MFPVDSIRKICKIRGTTLAEVERDTDISNGTIARWENSPRSPQFDHLQKIAKRLNCSIEELFTGELKNSSVEESKKNTATQSDGNTDVRSFINSLLDRMDFGFQIRAANEVQSLLQQQLAQDDRKESD